MCALNRLAIILLLLFAYFDQSIWMEIPLIILFVVCAWFADEEESDIKEKLNNHNFRIQDNEDYIAEMSKRLDKLENKINNEGE